MTRAVETPAAPALAFGAPKRLLSSLFASAPSGRARRVLTQGALAALSILAAIALCEVALRLFFPKYASVAEGHHYYANVSRIWSPRPNSSHFTAHPDTGEYIPVFYNDFGMRQHRQFDPQMLDGATNVAFFGDSFTENRRIRSAYSFTESLDFLLNLHEGAAFNVLKFGVDGYGPGQEFIWYRQFEQRDALDHVVYVFCDNDIGDFHRHGLFSLDDAGNLIENAADRTSPLISLLSRLHLTYLVRDAAQGMSLRSRDGPFAPPPLLDLADVEQRIIRRREEGSAFAGDALDDSIATFQALLLRWQRKVEARGGTFHVALLPYIRKKWAQEIIPKPIDVIDLHGCFSGAIPNYSYAKVSFKSEDAHWNETGNMVAADCLYRALEDEAGLPPVADEALAEARYEFYRGVSLGDGWMPSATWASRPTTMRHDPNAIRAKYMALDRNRMQRQFQQSDQREFLAHADWDIYLVQEASERDSLVYVKAPCHEEDLTRTFFLHVDAVDPTDLPPARQAIGYQNLDFGFAQSGGSWVGERCVVGTELPAYGIAEIRTGQYSVDNGEIRPTWQVEIPADDVLGHDSAE